MPSKITKQTKIDNLCYKMKALTKREREFINKSLTKQKLFYFVNTRYAPDPCRYIPMKKKELIEELKYPRYD